MEAKDTVMIEEEVQKLIDKWNDIDNKEMAYGTNARPSLLDMLGDVVNKQAEISFRAGMETALSKQLSEEQLSEHDDFIYKAGIQEAVEFINHQAIFTAETAKEGKPYTYLGSYILKWGREVIPSYGFAPFDECAEWQAKLKEWGL